MSKALGYYVETARTLSLEDIYGSRLEQFTADDKLSLIIVLATWLKSSKEISLMAAMEQSKTSASDEVHHAISLLEGLTATEAESLIRALIEQVRDREFAIL